MEAKLYESPKFGTVTKYSNKRAINNIGMFYLIFGLLAIIYSLQMRVNSAITQLPNASYERSCVYVATPTPTVVKKAKPVVKPSIKVVKSQGTGNSVSWKGKVSHYSRSGCLGCSATLTMANGETLDDERLTIAFNKLPMNTQVRLTNLDNGKSVVATVTDTGGFEKLGRIADLVPAVARELETKTDVSDVLIERL
jgi:rare lipoprotein A (peptidoglycan hydrolase)